MKKILLFSVIAGLFITGCKKKENTISELHSYSAPAIKLSVPQFYSIPVGGTIPTVTATAYDSFYQESCPVVIDQSNVNNAIEGLYTISATAKNKYGMTSVKSVYIAVTGVSDMLDLTGWYERLAPTRSAHITKMGTGLFMTSNVGGVDTTDPTTGAVISAVFAVTSTDSIRFGSQITSGGPLTTFDENLTLAPGDTSITYAVNLSGFGTQDRVFVKQ